MESIKNSRIEGFDYLRATMSVFVVVWHMGGGGHSTIFLHEKFLEHTFTLSDFLNFHVLLLAVPTFIFLSCFLYAQRGVDCRALRRRLKRILVLLTFWPIAFVIFKNGYSGLSGLTPRSPVDFLVIVLRAGNTIYYFFVSLIISLLLTHIVLRINARLQILCFGMSISFLACSPILAKIFDYYPLGAYWNPLNFVPIPFAAVLVAQNTNYIRSKMKIMVSSAIVLSAILSVFEWKYSVGSIFFPGQGYAIPAYTRSSLTFGVIALAIVALDTRIRSNRVVNYMANYSLALYCLHPFLVEPVKRQMSRMFQNEDISLYSSITLVIVLSYALATLLKAYYLKEEVIV